jgi:hypothetical protein
LRIKYSIKKEVTESELKEALDNGFRLDIEKPDNCPFEIQIHDLSKQSDKIDKFISDAEPLLEYVRAEIQRNDEKSRLYKKLYEQVLGWGVIGIVSLLGSWIFALMTIIYPVVCGKIRQYLGGL